MNFAFLLKIPENVKILLYFWKYLCYDGRAGYGRYIIMPAAQLREKPKTGFH